MDNNLDRLIARTWQERMSRRRFLRMSGLGMGAVALGPLLAACGPGGGGGAQQSRAAIATLAPPEAEVSFEFWHPFTGPDGPFMNDLVAQFNEETPNVQVEVLPQPGGGDYYNLIRSGFEADDLALVTIHHIDALPSSALDEILSPITDLSELLQLTADDFTEDVWNFSQVNGERYGIPLDIHPLTFYYNKEHFTDAGLDPESPPATGDDFIAAGQALVEAGHDNAFMFATNHNFLTGIIWASLFYQGGGQWTNEDFTEATFNSDAGVQASEWMRALVEEHGISPANTAGDEEIAAFKQGDASMVWSGPWEITGYREALGEDVVGFAPIPEVFGQGVWAGSHTFAVSNIEASDDERRGAYYFIDWMSRHSVEWAGAGQVPARASQRAELEGNEEAAFAAGIAPQVEFAKFPPPVPGAGELLFNVDNGAGVAAGRFITGDVDDAQAVLDESAEHWTQVLQETKETYGY